MTRKDDKQGEGRGEKERDYEKGQEMRGKDRRLEERRTNQKRYKERSKRRGEEGN